MTSRFLVLITLFVLARATCFAAAFMDLTVVTPGDGLFPGSFGGSLNGVGVTGTLTGGTNTKIEPLAPGVGFSTITDDSPQWGHAPVYTPIDPAADRVGFSSTVGPSGSVAMAFGAPMTNLIFHIANLDLSFLDFGDSFALGLTSITLLSGNGPPIGTPGDGLGVAGLTLFDIAAGTADPGTPPAAPPPVTGARSAYGSVRLNGTYTALDFDIIFPGGAGFDNANFTFSTPEPGMTTLAAMGLAGMFLRRRRRIG